MGAVLVQCLFYRFTARNVSFLNRVLKDQNSYLHRGQQYSYRELWTIAADLIPSAVMKCYTQKQSNFISFDSGIGVS
ncbi:hypothetical protein WH47_10628 [Habropoda laboriosa]|uniref:Uncharacterized protein n=1 Tax=Habropoda laboriosa TaxID=597456 RepID=A0A0L7QLI0_9HYME|nr:hypothetical protein WH47_10628 [Habropoda laboriosa]